MSIYTISQHTKLQNSLEGNKSKEISKYAMIKSNWNKRMVDILQIDYTLINHQIQVVS